MISNPAPRRSCGIILMRLGIAEIHEEPITKILCDIPVIAFNDGSTGVLIGTHDLAILFRVELLRQCSRIDQITEHHCQLATLAGSESRV